MANPPDDLPLWPGTAEEMERRRQAADAAKRAELAAQQRAAQKAEAPGQAPAKPRADQASTPPRSAEKPTTPVPVAKKTAPSDAPSSSAAPPTDGMTPLYPQPGTFAAQASASQVPATPPTFSVPPASAAGATGDYLTPAANSRMVEPATPQASPPVPSGPPSGSINTPGHPAFGGHQASYGGFAQQPSTHPQARSGSGTTMGRKIWLFVKTLMGKLLATIGRLFQRTGDKWRDSPPGGPSLQQPGGHPPVEGPNGQSNTNGYPPSGGYGPPPQH